MSGSNSGVLGWMCNSRSSRKKKRKKKEKDRKRVDGKGERGARINEKVMGIENQLVHFIRSRRKRSERVSRRTPINFSTANAKESQTGQAEQRRYLSGWTMYKSEWKERTNTTETHPFPQSSVQPRTSSILRLCKKSFTLGTHFSATPKKSHSNKQRRKGMKSPSHVEPHLLCCPFRFQFTYFILHIHKARKKN